MAIDLVLRPVLCWVNFVVAVGSCVKLNEMGIWKMNERILKLVQQAREYAWENETHWSANAERDTLFEQKFAELMLKASFDVVINDGRFHDAKGIIRAGKSVAMEHFGVEE